MKEQENEEKDEKEDEKTHENIKNNTKNQQELNLSLSNKVELKSHFDVVRKLCYLPNINGLVSVSEVY